jgi:hypothetical protein
MMLSEIIHSSPDKFSNLNNYYNFKRKITQAQKALNEASLYLTENEKMSGVFKLTMLSINWIDLFLKIDSV